MIENADSENRAPATTPARMNDAPRCSSKARIDRVMRNIRPNTPQPRIMNDASSRDAIDDGPAPEDPTSVCSALRYRGVSMARERDDSLDENPQRQNCALRVWCIKSATPPRRVEALRW